MEFELIIPAIEQAKNSLPIRAFMIPNIVRKDTVSKFSKKYKIKFILMLSSGLHGRQFELCFDIPDNPFMARSLFLG